MHDPLFPLTFTQHAEHVHLNAGPRTQIRIIYHSATSAEIRAGELRVTLEIVSGRGTVNAYIADVADWLPDIIASKFVIRDNAALLLVKPSSTAGVWICTVQQDASGWHWRAADLARPTPIDTSYALPDNPEQRQHLREAHREFMTLCSHVITPAKESRSSPVLLRVKVDPTEHWFLRFPLGSFIDLGLPGFDVYTAVQWIVSSRKISATATAQMQLEKEVSDTTRFFAGTHIVVNTYREWANALDATSIEESFDLLLTILQAFQDVPLYQERVSLRWTMNPKPEDLYDILRSPETNFLFANFEAAGGVWTLGDGPHRCPTPCDHQQSSTRPATFDLTRLREQLRHVRLLRAFHCNSLYDPYNVRTNPADAGTIAAALLDTGAYFIDASVTAEPVLDFPTTMISFLLGRADLRAILFARTLARECDFPSLLIRANTLLSKRGLSTINRSDIQAQSPG